MYIHSYLFDLSTKDIYLLIILPFLIYQKCKNKKNRDDHRNFIYKQMTEIYLIKSLKFPYCYCNRQVYKLCILLSSKFFHSNLQTCNKTFHLKETKNDLLSFLTFLCDYFQMHKSKHFCFFHSSFPYLYLFLLIYQSILHLSYLTYNIENSYWDYKQKMIWANNGNTFW